MDTFLVRGSQREFLSAHVTHSLTNQARHIFTSFAGGYVPGSEITARTPLCFATKDGLEEIVAILLEAGADVNQHDEW